MTEIIISVKTIKGLLGAELLKFTNHAHSVLKGRCLADAISELVHIGFITADNKLRSCQTYDDLEDYVGWVGYKMSLQEWLDSL